MQVVRLAWTHADGWTASGDGSDARLVLYFGSRDAIADAERYAELRARFPQAHVLGCSSESQIAGDEIVETGIAGVAIRFDHANIRAAVVTVERPAESFSCGEKLGKALAGDDLAGVLVLSDGLKVNGSELTRGISRHLRSSIPVSGGLAADGPHFANTLVGLDEPPRSGRIAAIGFYGKSLTLRTGSAGGWAAFGPRRRITSSTGNVLHTLDDRPALELYERYLGEDARDLPSSALLFPLMVFDPAQPDHSIVRTVLAIDRKAGTMTFAGDVPQGWTAQLMRGSVDRLAIGAAEAARQVLGDAQMLGADTLVLMVSCIGRRLLMGQRTVDEVEAVARELGPDAQRIGFYSYGEICPHDVSGRGEMHNQTMTITTISEAA